MRLALVLIALAAPADAACRGETLFSCEIGRKRLEVCLNGQSVSYRFGPEGRPELELATSLRQTVYQPWPGVGRAIWEAVSFTNRGTTYEVWSSFDRLAPEARTEGGVNVLTGSEVTAQLTCRPGSVSAGLDLLYGAKEAIGQCWNRDLQAWTAAPCAP